MKYNQVQLLIISIFLLSFMILGYLVTFFPNKLLEVDDSIQLAVRGSLPASLTLFFKIITNFGHEVAVCISVFMIAVIFYFWKKWKVEALFLVSNLIMVGIFSASFKYLFHRTRPNILYLIPKPPGYSFPSWHAMVSMIVALSFCIIIERRIETISFKRLLQGLCIAIAFGVAVSRIYLGVHYPSDILGGWLLTFAIIATTYPLYKQKCFE